MLLPRFPSTQTPATPSAHRRRVLALGVSTALAPPLRAFAQPAGAAPKKVWRIGFLSPIARPPGPNPYSAAFVEAMLKLGYVYQRDYVVELRSADGDYASLPALAAELVQRKADILLAWTSIAVRATQQASATKPIVFMGVHDPVGNGLAASLAHPGGHTTGLATFQGDFIAKHLEMLTLIAPKRKRIAVLVNPTLPVHAALWVSAQEAAKKAGMQVLKTSAQNAEGIERAFKAMVRERAGAVIVASDPFFNSHPQQLADLALKHKLASVFGAREDVVAGGLMSYGDSVVEMFRRVPYYLDRIFKGTPPSDLPIEQPAVFHCAINRKTATALGLKIPLELLLRADEVIE